MQKHAGKFVALLLLCCVLAVPAFSQGGAAPPSAAVAGSNAVSTMPTGNINATTGTKGS
jgi:hypothetical protein